MDERITLRSRMEDAGCDESSIARAEALYASGAKEDLVRCLRSCRCDQLDALHVRQKQLDRLDLLIRNAQNAEGEKAI
jgi:hypothetical protein